MDYNKTLELIDFLRSLGFKGRKLEQDILEASEAYQVSFSLHHHLHLEEEAARYQLKFIYDRQFSNYRLEGYSIAFRPVLDIEHSIIKGIDTAALEKEMASIYWDEYFHYEDNDLEYLQDLSLLFKNLWELSDENDPGSLGEQIQSQLIYKYWPIDKWNDKAYELQFKYERSETFTANEIGLPTALLAYHITAGHLDELYKEIQQSGIEQYSGIDVKSLLALHLSGDHKIFLISCCTQEASGILDCEIPVYQVGNRYSASKMDITFNRYPQCSHSIFNGLSSQALELQMQLIDWKTDKLFDFNEQQDVILLPHVQEIKDAIDRLNLEENGKEIANYLQVRYWHDSFMNVYVSDNAREMSGWPEVKLELSTTDDLEAIGNLVQGRPVRARLLPSTGVPEDSWLYIKPGALTAEGFNVISSFQGPTRQQLETMVNMLPTDGSVFIGDIVRALEQGNTVKLDLITIEGSKKVNITMPSGPVQNVLEVRSIDGEVIPFNFSLDSNWSPQTVQHNTARMESGIKNKPKGKRL